MIAPSAPPAAARIPKALDTISTIAAGILLAFKIRSSKEIAMYITAMNGTMISDTFAIRFNPPITTRPTQTVRISPEITTASV